MLTAMFEEVSNVPDERDKNMEKLRICLAISVVLSLLACAGCELLPRPTPTPTLEQLLTILQDPLSPDFWFATEELGKMGSAAPPEAARALAKALRYPRRDSYAAAEALIAIGPAAASAIPELVQALRDDLPRSRANAVLVFTSLGRLARCAVPDLARLLWDEDPGVRGTAAEALDAITCVPLLPPTVTFMVGGEILDDPEGSITGKARRWWEEEGRHLDWSGEPNLCVPNGP